MRTSLQYLLVVQLPEDVSRKKIAVVVVVAFVVATFFLLVL